MEQDGGAVAACAAGLIPLQDREQRYYSGLHGLCQADCSGKLTSSKVAELFKASQLSPEVLHKVTEVCGARRLGYFGTPQFYVALKLLAAAQAGLPVRLESASATNLPLPRFVGIQVEAQESWSPPPPSLCSSLPRSPPTYHTYEYAPHRKMADTVVQMEQHSSSSPYGTAAQATSKRQRTDEDEGDPWRMTEEQREYYTNQFQSLQPDLRAFIFGAAAKNFFTKSKLPIPELSHIWELSDVDRDGALNLWEFCTAFHLIVARKNGFPLPESLPPRLCPRSAPRDEDAPLLSRPLLVFGDGHTELNQTSSTASAAGAQQDVQEESHKAVCALRSVEALQEGATLQAVAFSGRPGASSQNLHQHTKTKSRPRSFSSTSIADAMRKAEEPPMPPPRPHKSHSRASSLDLNKLFQQGAPGLRSGWPPPPPALPPRPPTSQVPPHATAMDQTPPQTNFADFSRFAEEEESSVKADDSCQDLANTCKQDPSGGCHSDQAPLKPLRRKYRPDGLNPDSLLPPSAPFLTPIKSNQKMQSRRKREIQMAIRKTKESNAVLTRLNSELQQQLKAVHHERVTLETQLDLLRSAAST